MKRLAVAALVLFALAGCSTSGTTTSPEPTFEETCADGSGTVMEDSMSTSVTSVGGGVTTFGTVYVTLSLCLNEDGGILDMELR